jgi:UBX domain-containing protein 1
MSHLKSSDEDEEQGQAFYAGGSTTSGQQVLGPPKKNPIKDYVSDIFKLAQEGNIETFEPEPSSSSGSSGGRLYFGTGYRLGQTPDDQVIVKGPAKPSAKADSDDEEDLVVLKLWKEGYSVDDGDLRRYDDPANKEFFESIRRGLVWG